MDVLFRPSKCIIIDSEWNFLFEAYRNGNVYTFDIIELTNQSVKCLAKPTPGWARAWVEHDPRLARLVGSMVHLVHKDC